MKIDELIAELIAFAEEHGDDVKLVSEDDWPISGIEAYTSKIDGKVYGIILEG